MNNRILFSNTCTIIITIPVTAVTIVAATTTTMVSSSSTVTLMSCRSKGMFRLQSVRTKIINYLVYMHSQLSIQSILTILSR